MTSPYFSGPVPAYNNPPPQPEFFLPSVFVISNITTSQLAIITTTLPNNYVVGQLVRFTIPFPWQMVQANEQLAYVQQIMSPTQFVTDLDTTSFTAFDSSPTQPTRTLPQVMAVGDVNTGRIAPNGRASIPTFIPGSFINISPF
jgi:hypothetical protein